MIFKTNIQAYNITSLLQTQDILITSGNEKCLIKKI